MLNRILPRVAVGTLVVPAFMTLLTGSVSYAVEDDSPASDAPAPSASEASSLGSSQASKSNLNGAVIEIRELKRSGTGNYTQLVWTLNNSSPTPIRLAEFQNRTYNYSGSTSGSGLVLVDKATGFRFHPYLDSDLDCVCAGAEHAPKVFDLVTEPGTQNTYWASYQLPPDVETVTVEIPGFLPVKDVPVS